MRRQRGPFAQRLQRVTDGHRLPNGGGVSEDPRTDAVGWVGVGIEQAGEITLIEAHRHALPQLWQNHGLEFGERFGVERL